MKNLHILYTPQDIHAYARAKFRTNEFRDSYDRGGLVFQVVDRFSKYPKAFFETSDPYLEDGHFSSWWGFRQLRDYALDAVHDLYELHEDVHAGTMPVHPGLHNDTFMQMLGENEADASVTSEIAAYFDMPALRAKSFAFPIYADRFLNDPVYQAWWQENPADFIESMKYKRRNLMHPAHVPADTPETWIHNFAAQNAALGGVWLDRAHVVENMIWNFRKECRDPSIGPKKAMHNQLDFLQSDAIAEGTDIPFVNEARISAPIIWATKNKYAASQKAAAPISPAPGPTPSNSAPSTPAP